MIEIERRKGKDRRRAKVTNLFGAEQEQPNNTESIIKVNTTTGISIVALGEKTTIDCSRTTNIFF